MSDCEFLKGCIFFNDKMPMEGGLGSIFKRRYCQGDFQKCARYIVAKNLGRKKVPENLYPNMSDKAQALISG